MRTVPVILIFALLLYSCFEEDEMVTPHEQGDLKVGLASLGSDYQRQVYFDLNQNKEVASNIVSDWDLSFESSTGGWEIRLNSSKFMYAGNSFDTLFSAELNKEDLDMRFDKSDGNPDSTALGSWYEGSGDTVHTQKFVYLLDLGIDEQFRPVGLKKVQFHISGEDYMVRFANNDNSGDNTVLIQRDPGMDRVYFSFANGIVDIAPHPDTWSLLFSKYTTMLVTNEGEFYPYIVMGALLNPNGVTAALDTIHTFTEIKLADTIDLELTNQADVIGYDWKYYNFDAGLYTIVPGLAYVIKDRDGFYYKLRFSDFYSDQGEKGFPEFEYVRL